VLVILVILVILVDVILLMYSDDLAHHAQVTLCVLIGLHETTWHQHTVAGRLLTNGSSLPPSLLLKFEAA